MRDGEGPRWGIACEVLFFVRSSACALATKAACLLITTLPVLPSAVLPSVVYLTNLSNASRSSASRNGSSSIVSRTSAAKAYVSS